jgi:hypothetical protein
MKKVRKLNPQGLSRFSKDLMEVMEASPGHVFVSVDLASGEPTATSHYSQDRNYMNASFNMVGKEPYYDEHGVLQIDDIYLMGASRSPIAKDEVRKLFESEIDGLPFPKAWLKSPELKEYIQKKICKFRPLHKSLILGLGYAMGPKKMVSSAYEKGHILSLKNAKLFFKAYWEEIFKDLKILSNKLEAKAKKDGYLVNEFGYRLFPEPSYKSLNYFIQSTISGIVNALSLIFFTKATYARFVTVIHDELIFEIPEDKIEQAKLDMKESVDYLNQQLKWTVNIRTGFVVGKNLYEAK